jgi:hypothetical protein
MLNADSSARSCLVGTIGPVGLGVQESDGDRTTVRGLLAEYASRNQWMETLTPSPYSVSSVTCTSRELCSHSGEPLETGTFSSLTRLDNN